jgi:ubiquinone/menaquinone biosynthesis C-methylase UbiE
MGSIEYDGPELAERYDQVSDSQFERGLLLIEKMGVKSGDAALDVGCGTGRMALHVSKLVGPSGRVLGIDPSPYRINVASAKLNNYTPQNVRFEMGRGEDIGTLACGLFDHVYMCSVFHWIDDKPAALSGAYRLLKPGGMLGMTTADREEPSTMRGISNAVLSKPQYKGQVVLSQDASKPVTTGELESLLAAAGFTQIDIQRQPRYRYFSTPDEAFAFNEASSFGNFLKHVPESLRPSAKREIAEELEKRRTPEGIKVAMNPVFATARKPSGPGR